MAAQFTPSPMTRTGNERLENSCRTDDRHVREHFVLLFNFRSSGPIPNMLNPHASLVMIGVITLPMVVIIVLVRMWRWLSDQHEQPEATEHSCIETTAQYRRYVLASMSANTQYGWDHHVRPVLSRLAWPTGDNPPHHGGDHPAHDHCAVRELLGDTLFTQLDPSIPACGDPRASGPGQDTLNRVVELLERRAHTAHAVS